MGFRENTNAWLVRAKSVRKKTIAPCVYASSYVLLHIRSICARLRMCICVYTMCTHQANSLNEPKLVMLGTGPPIWGKYNPSSSLTLRLNKGKLRCPSRKSPYEKRSCSVPHSEVCNPGLQGTNKMTFHTPIGPIVSICSFSCWTLGGFFNHCLCHFSLRLTSWCVERNVSLDWSL